MKFELVEIEDLSDGRCHIYSVLLDNQEKTELEKFYSTVSQSFPEEVLEMMDRLEYIGHERGADEFFFKLGEGRPGDGVCALFDRPDAHLRLYCIRFGSLVLVVGGGGEKPRSIRTWQEKKDLSDAATLMVRVSETLARAIREKDLIIMDDGSLKGCFQYELGYDED